MITKEEKEAYKEVLGHRYVTTISKELERKKEFKNNEKEPYSSSLITNVMNGQTHTVIEAIIEDLVIRLKEKKNKKNKKIKTLLNKKPAVGAAG